MNFIMKYGIAYVMDLIFGDPHWFPHPVRIIGKLISFLEKVLYKASNKKISGAFLTVIVVGVTFVISYYISSISYILEIFFLYTTLATKSLADEGFRVCKILTEGDLEKAKKELS
ncbi:cobalamin biosynthesis protein, partial [uncultured Fusobacterium sp.]|uniref:cobalamin biosynthesis protein n=1 Tax=uncultured Fusobacterium sp. TaxID=159267 RepID=UPI0025921252